eukprot:gene7657-11977_t
MSSCFVYLKKTHLNTNFGFMNTKAPKLEKNFMKGNKKLVFTKKYKFHKDDITPYLDNLSLTKIPKPLLESKYFFKSLKCSNLDFKICLELNFHETIENVSKEDEFQFKTSNECIVENETRIYKNDEWTLILLPEYKVMLIYCFYDIMASRSDMYYYTVFLGRIHVGGKKSILDVHVEDVKFEFK